MSELKKGLSLTLLAYKEEENLKVLLPDVIDSLKKCGEEYEILVIDTAEPLDNTKAVCEQYGARYINQREPGFGGAMKTAIADAEYDKFMIMDSDGSHPPKFIPDLYNMYATGKYDVVIGSRYIKGGITHDAMSSKIMSHMLNFAYRIAMGINAKDLSTNFRIYGTEALRAIKLKCEKYDILEESLMKLKLKKPDRKLRVGETPIEFNKRLSGESKRDLLPFIISYIKTLFWLFGLRISGKTDA